MNINICGGYWGCQQPEWCEKREEEGRSSGGVLDMKDLCNKGGPCRYMIGACRDAIGAPIKELIKEGRVDVY